jgi:hypothetical protein
VTTAVKLAAAVTAYGRAGHRVRALAEGYSMHVPKPADPTELTTIIASLSPPGSQAERNSGRARGEVRCGGSLRRTADHSTPTTAGALPRSHSRSR